MKKSLLLGLVCTLMLGVSGCMSEETNVKNVQQVANKKDNKLVNNMLQDLNESTNESLIEYKFFPSKKGFNTNESYSYLLAENKDNLKVIVFEKNERKGNYLNNYNSVLAAKYLETYLNNLMNFAGNVFVSIESSDLMSLTKEEIERDYLNLIKEEDTIDIFVTVEKFDEETIKELFYFYKKIREINKMFSFQVATTKDLNKTREFVDYYSYYALNYNWATFDETAEIKMRIYREEFSSLDSFKSFILEVK